MTVCHETQAKVTIKVTQFQKVQKRPACNQKTNGELWCSNTPYLNVNQTNFLCIFVVLASR